MIYKRKLIRQSENYNFIDKKWSQIFKLKICLFPQEYNIFDNIGLLAARFPMHPNKRTRRGTLAYFFYIHEVEWIELSQSKLNHYYRLHHQLEIMPYSRAHFLTSNLSNQKGTNVPTQYLIFLRVGPELIVLFFLFLFDELIVLFNLLFFFLLFSPLSILFQDKYGPSKFDQDKVPLIYASPLLPQILLLSGFALIYGTKRRAMDFMSNL